MSDFPAERDFPAAHSMDTDWFAVDENGYVARFQSGEAGAIPLQAPTGPGPSDASFDYTLVEALELARFLSTGKDPFERDEAPPPSGPPYRTPGRSPRQPLRPMKLPDRVVLIVDGEPPRSFIDAGKLIAIRTQPPGVYVTAGEVKRADWPSYEAIPHLRDAFPADQLYGLIDSDASACFFDYANQDYGAPGAYERHHAPDQPMKVDELPAILRDEFGKVRLPVKFAEQPALQLADYMKDEETAIWGESTLRGEPLPPSSPIAIERERQRKPATRTAGLVTLGILVLFFVLALAGRC